VLLGHADPENDIVVDVLLVVTSHRVEVGDQPLLVLGMVSTPPGIPFEGP